ncbi:MAG: chorismate synthase [Bacilli bacterium]
MKSNFGHNLNYSLFGESHSMAIGITINGLPANFKVDLKAINQSLALRQGSTSYNTPRQEAVSYEIVSGLFNEHLTGTPLTVLFYNNDTKSKDYLHLIKQPRPGHADLVSLTKYQGAGDFRGGGHFSGRLTTPLVFLGSLVQQIIKESYPTLKVISHISSFMDINDYNYYYIRDKIVKQIFSKLNLKQYDAQALYPLSEEHQKKIATSIKKTLHQFLDKDDLDLSFPVFNEKNKVTMMEKAIELKSDLNTAGGRIETIIINPPLNLGDPFFNSFESYLAHLMYSIPSVKALLFGYGHDFSSSLGSDVKDEIINLNNQGITTLYNYNGGLNGGISNGEDIVFTNVIKPISSLALQQYSYSLESNKIEPLEVKGRHDATIINRIIPVIDALTYITLYEFILENKKQ